MEIYRCIKSEPMTSEMDPGWFVQHEVSPHFFDRALFHVLVLKHIRVENQFKRVSLAKLTTRSYFDRCEERMVEIV